ncbi:tail fiber domain-containing protein [Stenotrophomonas geniculata]|uniref:tail fiber domain-containing protein n=1 Tax=Stenotrophomonas geniculata TaxID=86188 RepID=UPI00234EE90C|nr:tail fiber domain-containing protein [Stenotrophomonas geniculata]MDC7800309.1 tail fiber domain-containing protein [Stenotrophomonas geniculata]
MPKYADPSVYPVGTPAATDNVMTRTAAGADGNFALGNLAGIAGLTPAADLSFYNNGTAWATYTVTSVGRTLLAATTQAAQRTAIQAVGLTGSETVAGTKTYTSTVQIQNTGPGFWLDETDGTAGALISLDSGRVQLQNRGSNFGPFVSRLLNIAMDGSDTGIGGTVNPLTDNSQSLGSSGRRWTAVWAVNASIQTSDARLKTEPRQLRDAELKAASAIARLPAVWRWLSRVHGDDNCEPEGMDARKHFGPTVQAAMAVMEAHGLDPFAYSFICYDEWEAEPEQWHEWEAEVDPETGEVTREAGRELIQLAREAGNRYSFRKEELLCFMVSALAAENDLQAAKVEALDARLAALEAKT